MKKLVLLCGLALSLAACGVDGAPSKPRIGGTTKVGVHSHGGPFTQTELTIHLGS